MKMAPHNKPCTDYTPAVETAARTDTIDQAQGNIARQNRKKHIMLVYSISSSRSLNQEEVRDRCGGAFTSRKSLRLFTT